MPNKGKILSLILLGVCLILAGNTAQHLFTYTPLTGWIGGLVCLLVATAY